MSDDYIKAVSEMVQRRMEPKLKESIRKIAERFMKPEWQDPDSGYLNCIGVGDTYVRKQLERIANNSYICRFIDGEVIIREKKV